MTITILSVYITFHCSRLVFHSWFWNILERISNTGCIITIVLETKDDEMDPEMKEYQITWKLQFEKKNLWLIHNEFCSCWPWGNFQGKKFFGGIQWRHHKMNICYEGTSRKEAIPLYLPSGSIFTSFRCQSATWPEKCPQNEISIVELCPRINILTLAIC